MEALALMVDTKQWPMREPFAIARGVQTEASGLVVTLIDDMGRRGRGEACGVTYAGETLQTMSAQVFQIRNEIESGIDRHSLLELLPPGGARSAIDAALWDLQAKQSGSSAFTLAGVSSPAPICTAYTIGIRSIDAYREAAKERAAYGLLKLKVNSDNALAAVAAAREGAPQSAFIVDPNQSWSIAILKSLAPRLVDLGVTLLEQPIAVGDEAELDGYRCPIALCADELINERADLDKAEGRFDVINIKLDKTGGLTAALRLADDARTRGFSLMVGCMAGSSLAMAPAMVLAQQCVFADLDGPLLQAEDWPDALVYRDGIVALPEPALWG